MFKDQAGGAPDIVVGLCVGGDEWDPFAVLSKELNITMSAFFNMHEFAVAIDTLASLGPFRPQALITQRIDLPNVPTTFFKTVDASQMRCVYATLRCANVCCLGGANLII